MSVCFSPVSNEIASISQDRALMVSNLETHKMKKVPICHGSAKPEKVVINGTGKIFTIGDDATVRIWQNIWNMA